jgi:chitinase
VWHGQVFQSRYWHTGFAPDTPVALAQDSPWTLLGPVLPGDTPAPLPTLPAGSYPQWDGAAAYSAGSQVQLGLVPYEAKWWSQGQQPGVTVVGGSPWVLITAG